MEKNIIENYNFAQCRMSDLFEFLKNKYSCKILYFESYFNYFKLSEFGEVSIKFNDLNYINNSISLCTYFNNDKYDYFLSFWYYSGGDTEGHHTLKFNLDKNFVSNDNIFFNFVVKYINDFFYKCSCDFKQLSIFDFI